MSATPVDKEQIFNRAAEIADPAERAAFLDSACGGDVRLRAEIEGLLLHDRDAGSFLERPPAAFVATIASGQFDSVDESGDDLSLDFLQPSDKPGCLGTLGPYQVIELVGRGGMGLVLRAHDPKLNRVVAIKVMAPELAANTMAVKRFLREAQAAAAVAHDHVVTIHAINDVHRPPFIVMEFIDGQSLQEKIDGCGALELVEILRIGMQTAAGLAAAHKQGLVHRDVKPANILLENGVERVKLTDFGLARAVDDVGVTQTGQIAGTPQYMSPEQAQGHAVDHRSDLFSLGSVLYTMCTGRPAFRAETAVAMLRRVTDDTPRPIREVNREIPDWLEAIIAKLLAKDPAERFQSAAEVGELLSQHLAHIQHPATAPLPQPIVPPIRGTDFLFAHPGTDGRFEKPSYKEPASRRSNILKMLAPITLVVLLLLAAGLTYWHVGDRGTLVIESDDPSVTVRIGRRRDMPGGGFDLTVLERVTGSGDVRLRSGTYRLVCDLPDFLATPDLIVLGRGEQVVVKVLRVAVAPTSTAPFRRYESPTSTAPFRRYETGKPQPLDSVAVSPDGQYLCAGDAGSLTVWKFEKRVPMWSQFVLDPQLRRLGITVRDVAFTPDSRHILTAADDSNVKLWNVETGREVRRYVGHTGWVSALAVSSDGKQIVTGSIWYPHHHKAKGRDEDNTLRLWDFETGKEIRRFDDPGWPVKDVAFSPEGESVVAGGENHTAGIWNVETGRLVVRLNPNPPLNVLAVAFAPDGKSVATGYVNSEKKMSKAYPSDSCIVILWDSVTGQEIRRFWGHNAPIRSIAFSRDGKLLATGSGVGFVEAIDNTVRVWSVASGEELERFRPGTTVNSVAFTPDGQYVISAGGSRLNAGTLGEADLSRWRLPESVWPTKAAKETPIAEITLVREFSRRNSVVLDIALTPDGRHALSGGWNGYLAVWDVAAGSFLHAIEKETDKGIGEVAIAPDGRRAVASAIYDKLFFVDLREPRIVHEVEAHKGMISGLAMSPDGKRVVTGGHDLTAAVWDTETGKELRRLKLPFQCYAAAFVPDGRHVVLAGSGGYCQLWDLESGRQLRDVHGHVGNIYSAVASADGRRLLTGCEVSDPTVRLWDLQTDQIIREFHGHKGCIWTVDFLPDGRHILSGCDDGTMRVWSIADGREVARASWPNAALNHLAVTPDGRHVLSGGGLHKEKGELAKPTGDYALRLWRLPDCVSPEVKKPTDTPDQTSAAKENADAKPAAEPDTQAEAVTEPASEPQPPSSKSVPQQPESPKPE